MTGMGDNGARGMILPLESITRAILQFDARA
jgi:hypothetical protein